MFQLHRCDICIGRHIRTITIFRMLIDASLHWATKSLYNLSHSGGGLKFLSQGRATYCFWPMPGWLCNWTTLWTIIGCIVGTFFQKITGWLATHSIFTLRPTPSMFEIIEETMSFLQYPTTGWVGCCRTFGSFWRSPRRLLMSVQFGGWFA